MTKEDLIGIIIAEIGCLILAIGLSLDLYHDINIYRFLGLSCLLIFCIICFKSEGLKKKRPKMKW